MVTALDEELTEVLSQDDPNRLGLMLYGSVARGTADSGSDIDVLELVTGPAFSYAVGKANVTQYEVSHLRSLAEQGSLFVLHLRTEGLVLKDPTGVLQRTLDAYVRPRTYSHIWRQIQDASAALDPAATDFDSHVPSLARLGIYLLRTSVYVRNIEVGEPTFNLAAIDWLNADPELSTALAMRRQDAFSIGDVELLRRQLGRFLPDVNCNPYPSIEALAVAKAAQPDLAALFTAVLQGDDGVDYSALTVPPF